MNSNIPLTRTSSQIAFMPKLGAFTGTSDIQLKSRHSASSLSGGQYKSGLHATGASTDPASTAKILFDATAAAKVWTAQVAMHLDPAARDRFFRQLDTLHDQDEWVGEDQPLALSSYKTFIRSVVVHKINSKPGLSLMPSGNILAIWTQGADKLTVEFLPHDSTRWMVHTLISGQVERAAGVTQLGRLKAVLQPYNAERWFDGG